MAKYTTVQDAPGQTILRVTLTDDHLPNQTGNAPFDVIITITEHHVDVSIEETQDTTGIRLESCGGEIRALIWTPEVVDGPSTSVLVTDDLTALRNGLSIAD